MSEQIDTPETPKQKIYYDKRSVSLRTTQCAYFVQEHDKTSMLLNLLEDYKDTQTIIVVRSKKKADILKELLIEKDFKALSLHGNHRKEVQEESTIRFNLGALNILITTDMIFQALELESIKLVINYDLPDMVDDYYNRLVCLKELGEAITLVSPEDDRLLSMIELNMKQEMQEKTLEGFVPSTTSNQARNSKKDRKKKPRHRKVKVRKEKRND